MKESGTENYRRESKVGNGPEMKGRWRTINETNSNIPAPAASLQVEKRP